MKIRNLKIGVRLGLGFGLVVLMTAVDGFIDITDIENVWDNTEKMYRHPLVVSNAVRDIRANIIAMHCSMKDVALAMNDRQIDLAEIKVNENEKEVYDLFNIVFERFLGDKSDEETAYNAFVNWKVIRDEVIQLVHDGEKEKAAEITIGKGAEHVSYMNEKIQTMIDFANNKADSFYEGAIKSKQRAIATHLLILSSMIVMSLIIAFIITRGITNPIGEMTEVSRKIEKGDYGARSRISTKDETGFLAQTINNMAASIQSHREHLEEVVEKRTAELIKSNEQLRQEIIDRRQAEEELRQYEYIVSSSTDMIALLDKRFVYVAANKAYFEAFEMTANQVIGHTVSEVFGEEFFDAVIKPKANSCLTGEEVHYQGWFDFPAYEPMYMDVTYFPYTNVNNEVKGFAVNARNITERMLAEEQIKNQNILLEKAVQEKQHEMEVLMERLIRQEKLAAIGQISGSIAHELRNPLSTIKQSIFYLNRLHKNDKLASSNSKVHEHLKLLSTEIDTSDRVISDLLQMTKVEPLKKEQTNLQAIISEAVKRCSIEEGIQIKTDLNPEPFLMRVDPLQMRQVLINLLSNAAQAISQKGLVKISAKMLNNDEKYLIEIQDNGCGIATKNLNKAFEPLFTTKAKGTGLGLSICKQIIENHGGSITLSSQINEGTTVIIELPFGNNKKHEI